MNTIEERDAALAAIEAAIASDLPLDAWRKYQLADALGSFFSGLYMLAAAEAAMSEWPAEQHVPMDETEKTKDVTLDDLKRALEEARETPLRESPIFHHN